MEKVETEGEERVEPAPLQIALLYKILQAQRETLQFLKETTAEGVDFPIPEQTVTEAALINFVKEYPYRKIRSIDFFNKGPDTAYIRVNEETKEIPIENREELTINRPRAVIEHITIRVDKGKTATLRMVGHY